MSGTPASPTIRKPLPATAARPVVLHSPAVVAMPDPGRVDWWFARLPGRLLLCLKLACSPVAFVGWLLECCVNAAVVGSMVLIWAWWTGRVTDEQVASVLGQLGARAVSILAKSGVI